MRLHRKISQNKNCFRARDSCVKAVFLLMDIHFRIKFMKRKEIQDEKDFTNASTQRKVHISEYGDSF